MNEDMQMIEKEKIDVPQVFNKPLTKGKYTMIKTEDVEKIRKYLSKAKFILDFLKKAEFALICIVIGMIIGVLLGNCEGMKNVGFGL